MKSLIILLVALLTLVSCGQSQQSDSEITAYRKVKIVGQSAVLIANTFVDTVEMYNTGDTVLVTHDTNSLNDQLVICETCTNPDSKYVWHAVIVD